MSYTGVFLTLKRKPLIVLNSRCLPLPVLFRNSNPCRFCWTILSWKWAMMFFTLWPLSPSAGQRVQGWVDKGVNSYWSLEEKHLNLRVGTPCSLSSWPPTRELIILFMCFLEIFIKVNLLKNSEASGTYIFGNGKLNVFKMAYKALHDLTDPFPYLARLTSHHFTS